jgi:AraC family transcriptional regulator, transcriptional activator of pobA
MDSVAANLYFFAMNAPHTAAARRSGHRPPEVPAFFLYGEPLRPPDERVVHVETVAARSALHDWVIHPHRHRDLYQVLLIQRGHAEVRLDERATQLRAPAAIIVPPGAVHSFRFQRGTVGLVISFAPTLAPGSIGMQETCAAAQLERAAAGETDLWSLGTMLLREFGRSATGRHIALRGLLGALLANLLRLVRAADPPASSDSAPARELVARFRQCMESRFRAHASMADYHDALQISASRLRRACLAVTGQSPGELVQQRMLIEAERQLRYTSMTVAQVAYFLGFDDPAYFSRYFARRTGLAPRAFRARDGAVLTTRGHT